MRESRLAYGLELTCAYMRLYPAYARESDRVRSSPTGVHKELIMTTIPYRTALIVGAGSGISASVARGLAAAGLKVGLAARNVEKVGPLAAQTGAGRFAVDASDPAAVARLFDVADARLGVPDVVLYNARPRADGPVAELE